MASDDRGPLLYAYRPIPANPMTVAVLLLVLVVTFGIGPIAAGPGGVWALGGACFVPVGPLLLAIPGVQTGPHLVFAGGIEILPSPWRRPAGGPRLPPLAQIPGAC